MTSHCRGPESVHQPGHLWLKCFNRAFQYALPLLYDVTRGRFPAPSHHLFLSSDCHKNNCHYRRTRIWRKASDNFDTEKSSIRLKNHLSRFSWLSHLFFWVKSQLPIYPASANSPQLQKTPQLALESTAFPVEPTRRRSHHGQIIWKGFKARNGGFAIKRHGFEHQHRLDWLGAFNIDLRFFRLSEVV